MRKPLVFTMLVVLLGLGSPSGAITDGELDGDAHPNVVLVVMDVDGEPAFRCSGTLMTRTVVLTAGHCANSEFSGIRVFTQSDVDAGKANGTNNYPYPGPNTVEAVEWHAHPEYTDESFFRHDVAVVVLSEPVDVPVYGRLPEVDELDAMATRRGKQDETFTAVGYGLQEITPAHIESARVRMVAHPRLVQINTGFTGDFSLLLSNNHSTGGTCFGDSGGPNFRGTSNVVAGVTSFGLNGTCGGTGGVFRMDRKNVVDFVQPFLS